MFLANNGKMNILLASSERQFINPSELDIYHEPEESVRIITDKDLYPTLFHENVASARKYLTQMFSGLLSTHEKVLSLFSYAEDRLTGVCNEALNDPYSMLIPGSITLATIGGAVIAGKGKRPVRRILYAGFFGTTAYCVTHPQRTLDIATTGYYHTTGSLANLSSYFTSSEETITEKVENESDIIAAEKEIIDLIEKPVEDESPIRKFVVESLEEVDTVKSEDMVVEDLVKADDTVVSTEADDNENISSTEVTPDNTAENLTEKLVIENDSIDIENVEKDQQLEFDNKAPEVIIEEDHGQSSEQDDDMYSTRS